MKCLVLRVAAFFLALPATVWARYHERRILRLGEPLDDIGHRDATCLGVSHPEHIRILCLDTIPNPFRRLMGPLERRTGLCITDAAGLTLRHGIFVTTPHRGDRALIAHELVHTRQFEQCGGHLTFLTEYIHQCLLHGYHNAPLEQEAREDSAVILPLIPTGLSQ